MEFLLLGPLEVRLDGNPLPLGPRRAERCLLGLLLLEADKLVPADRLCDLLWDGAPPENALAILQTHVSRLRSRLDPKRDGRHGFQLIAHGIGYQAAVSPESVDAFRFRAQLTTAEAISDPREKSAALRSALALWRGPLLADVATDRLRDRIGTGLDESRLSAWESCMEAELAAGRHREIIPELNDLVAANPLRERLVHSLMLALYKHGRQSCALDAFRDAKAAINEQTGLDVGPRLTELQEAILRDEAAPSEKPSPGKRVPRQLPPDISHFVGRAEHLDSLIELARSQRGRFLTIAAIHGPGGTGKSALATRAAYILSDDFTDGQLYLDLQGSTPGLPPLRGQEGLERWLRALGVDNRVIPNDEAEASAAFRDLTSERRMIFMLDNVRDAAQIKPLLPSNPECLVIVTSRTVLSTIDNTTHLKLDMLSEDEAIALMGRFDSRAANDGTSSHIVRRCGYLPLAIRIAGARIASRPEWTLKDLKDELDREHARLDVLQVDDLSVRASIKVSYDGLGSDPLAKVGRLDFVDLTKPVLDSLFYGADESGERTIANTGLKASTASLAVQLVTCVRFPLVDMMGRWNALRDLGGCALTTARRINDAKGEAESWFTLSITSRYLGKYEQAADQARNAIRRFRELADAKGEASALFALSNVHRTRSEWELAAHCLEQAIAVAQAAGLRRLQANFLDNLGTVFQRMERFQEAIRYHEAGLRIRREENFVLGIAASLENLAWTHLASGDPLKARPAFEEAANLAADVSYFTLQAGSLWGLGNAQRALGNAQAARAAWDESVAIYRRLSLMEDSEAERLLATDEPEMPSTLRALLN